MVRTGGPEARRPSLLDEADASMVSEPVDWEQTLRRARRQRVRRIGAVTLGAAAVIVLVVGVAAGLLRPSVELFTPAGDPADALWGRTFFSVSAIDDGQPRPLAPGTRIRLTFKSADEYEGDNFRKSYGGEGNGAVAWDAGCNRKDGGVTIMPDRILSTGRGFFSTRIDCRELEDDQESWVARFLGSEPAWTLTGDRLVLTSGDDVIVLTEDGEPPTAPADALWGRTFFSVSAIEDGRPRPLAPDTRISLTFERAEEYLDDMDVFRDTYGDGNGVLEWDAGCNSLVGGVMITPERILDIGPDLSTDALCRDVMEQESWVGRFLGSDPTWELTGDRLVLTSGDDVIVLTEDGEPPTAPADALWGRTFFSVSAIEDGRPRPLAPDTRIRLSFGSDEDIEGDIDALRESYEHLESDLAWEDGSGYMSWDAGCNQANARVAITAEGIRTGGGLSTGAGCRDEVSEQESWVRRFLGSEPAWELEGDRLVLTSGDDVLVLTEEAHAPDGR